MNPCASYPVCIIFPERCFSHSRDYGARLVTPERVLVMSSCENNNSNNSNQHLAFTSTTLVLVSSIFFNTFVIHPPAGGKNSSLSFYHALTFNKFEPFRSCLHLRSQFPFDISDLRFIRKHERWRAMYCRKACALISTQREPGGRLTTRRGRKANNLRPTATN